MKPLFPHTVVTSAIAEIPDVPRFQSLGFQFCEFMGCWNEREGLMRLSTHCSSAIHLQPELPQCAQKRMRLGENRLEAGDHEPLLMYLGRKPNRSDEALARREHKAARRLREKGPRPWPQKARKGKQQAGKGWQQRGTVGQGYAVPPWRGTETGGQRRGEGEERRRMKAWEQASTIVEPERAWRRARDEDATRRRATNKHPAQKKKQTSEAPPATMMVPMTQGKMPRGHR